MSQELKRKIERKQAIISVIGLGYVGLPLALEFAAKGFFVFGYDTNKARIKRLKEGINYISDVDEKKAQALIKKGKFLPTSERKVLGKSDVIIICVPTPLRKVKIPDISYIIAAVNDIKTVAKNDTLIVLESTTYPGTCREVILPELEKARASFFLAFSPERIDPGNKKYPLAKIPKVIGGLNKESAQLAAALYKKIIKRVFLVSTLEAAEMVKILENTFRFINLALINEFAILARNMKIDIWEVIKAASTKPFGFMPFYPGPGIGGHCIPVDPLYIAWRAKRAGFKTKMIDLALKLNRYMPRYVVERIKEMLKEKKIPLKKAKVLVCGVAYKKNVKDLRESPALEIIEMLQKQGAKVEFYDPIIPYLNINGIRRRSVPLKASTLKKWDCVVIVTDHSGVDYGLIRKKASLIFDTRNVYGKNFFNVRRL